MSTTSDVALAVTCHDPLGRFAPGIEDAGRSLSEVFGALAVNATAETHPATIDALRALDLPTSFGEHGAGTVGIGTARQDALALGIGSALARVFYSDLDHVLRWLSTARDEVERCLAERDQDLLVVGRSAAAMAEAPERLRRTEELVNHAYRGTRQPRLRTGERTRGPVGSDDRDAPDEPCDRADDRHAQPRDLDRE